MADARNSKIVDENLEAVTGLVTLFKDVPVLIELALFDMEGNPYSADALNGYEWGFVIANDYNKVTPPQLRANAVSVAGNALNIEIQNMNTVELNNELKDEKSIRLGAELTGKKDGVDNWVIQFNCSIRNRRDSTGNPTPVQRDYYTKPETNALIENVSVDLSDYYTRDETDNLIAENVVGAENTVVESFNTAAHVVNDTLTYETEGRVLQVIDNTGNIVLPDVEFIEKASKLFSVITASDMSFEGVWTVYKVIGALQFTELDLTPYQLKSDTFDGDYNKLANKPVIPSKTSDLTNDSGFITAGEVPQGEDWNKRYLGNNTIYDGSPFVAADKDWFIVNSGSMGLVLITLPDAGTVRVTNHGWKTVRVGSEIPFGMTVEFEYLAGTWVKKVLEFCKVDFSSLTQSNIRGKLLGFDASYNLATYDRPKNYIENCGDNATSFFWKDGFILFTRFTYESYFEIWLNPYDYASDFEQNFELDLTLDYPNMPISFQPTENIKWLETPDFSQAGTYRLCFRFNAVTNKYLANVAYFIGGE